MGKLKELWEVLLDKFIEKITYHDPSEYDDYYDNTSWKTFRIDEGIWNRSVFKQPAISYYRELQVCYVQLLEEHAESYLFDTKKLREEFNSLHLERCRLEKENAQLRGEILALKDQVLNARKWQNATGYKAEVDESIGFTSDQAAARATEHEAVHNVQRNGNRFSNADGLSKQEKQMLAATYFENQWTVDEIAEELKVSKSTIKTYISTIRSHYEVRFITGSKYICFDSQYGNVQWMLALYDKMDIKYPNLSENNQVNSTDYYQ